MQTTSTVEVLGAPAAGAPPAPIPFKPVERIDASDVPYQDFLKRYVHAGRPVVVRNAVTRWPALQKWKPEYFKQRFGQKPVAVARNGGMMPFDQFIDEVMASSEAAPGPYMSRTFLHEHIPELLEDVIPQNAYAFPRRHASPIMPRVWRRADGYLKLLIGGPGSKFPDMHYDGGNAHAAITEIFGDKEMLLYAPQDGPYLYPHPEFPNVSRVQDPHQADLAQFPLVQKATQYRTVIGPGETIFIPCGWWHTARPLNPSVSVCTNMLDGSNWGGFVAEVAGPTVHPVKRAIKRAALVGLGMLLSLCEYLQDHFPALARLLYFPAKLSPVSAEVAPEPSAQQLKIWSPG